jgi:hypothetical protein
MRKLLGALTLAALAGLAPISPAPAIVATPPSVVITADHAWSLPHWRQDVYPAVTTPGCYYNWCDQIADAAYYWQDRGYYKGFTPPLPRNDWPYCESRISYINVCFVNYGDPRLNGNIGYTTVTNRENQGDPAHTAGAMIFVCGNCSNWERQATMRHEMGHALGLNRTFVSWECVMHEPVYVNGETCSHDITAMQETYSYRNHPV